jgi:DNA-binding transcriptional ArsR family regulator
MQTQAQKELNLIELSSEGIVCLDQDHKISFMSKGASTIFHANNDKLLNKTLEELDLEKLIPHIKERTSIKLNIDDKNYIAVTSPVNKDGEYLGSTVLLLDNHLLNKASCNQMYLKKKEKKRTFEELRKNIIIDLDSGKKTINQISMDTGINWKTVEKHLTYLLGKKLIEEVYNSDYLRIFDLTDKGRIRTEEHRQEERAKLVRE